MELEEFIERFAEEFEDTDKSEFTADTDYKELEEWDSMHGMYIFALIESEFGVEMTREDLNSCKTIGELYEAVKAKAK